MEGVTEKEIGEMVANIRNIADAVVNMNKKMDVQMSFQAATEERLRTGSSKFSEHRKAIEDNTSDIHEIKVTCIERCKSQPSGKLVYIMITLGFVVLGLLSKFLVSPSSAATTYTTKSTQTQTRTTTDEERP